MRRLPLEAWLFLLVLVFNLYAAVTPANSQMMWWFSSDDAFYYFKTAQNIAEGHGVTFDGLGRDSGFHPLWMLLLVPVFVLARFDLILPLRLVIVLSGLLSAATALVLFRLARQAVSREAALLTALFFSFSPFIHNRLVELGLESGLSVFFLALLFERTLALTRLGDTGEPVRPRAYLLTGVVALLAILARLDNVFIVLTAAAWVVARAPAQPSADAPRRTRALRAYLSLDLALIAFGVLWSYFQRVGFGPHYAVLAASSYWMAAAALAVRLPVYAFLGLYRPPRADWRGLLSLAARALLAAALSSLVLTAIMISLQALRVFPGFPRLTLAYEGGFALAALLVTRLAGAFLQRFAAPSTEDAPSAPSARACFWVAQPLDWKTSFTRAVYLALPVLIGMAVYMTAHQIYFGTPSPVSGQVKRWWGTLPNPIYGRPVDSLSGLLGLSGGNDPWGLAAALAGWPALAPAAPRYALYGLAAAGLLWTQRRRVRQALAALPFLPLFTGGMIHLLSYTGTGYLHTRVWYWAGQTLLITLLFSVILDAFLQTARQWQTRVSAQPRFDLARWLTVGLAAWFVLYGAFTLMKNMPLFIPAENRAAYLSGVRALEETTQPGAIIGSTGGGVVAYFIYDRTIVNLDGLMDTSEYFHLLQAGRAAEYLDQINLQYVYAGALVITDSDPFLQFKDRLERLRDFPDISLYRWVKRPSSP